MYNYTEVIRNIDSRTVRRTIASVFVEIRMIFYVDQIKVP